MHQFVERLWPLADLLGTTHSDTSRYVSDLEASPLMADLRAQVRGMEEFSQVELDTIDKFHLFRTMLYVAVRALKPKVFLETGVLNGFSSAFILQAMADNGHGRLVSIDLPLQDTSLFEQGTAPLLKGKEPGWAIPAQLRARHDLRLGDARKLLPAYLLSERPPDIFMHDSDHAYDHLMFELSLAWVSLQRGSFIVVDNVELNAGFDDFCRGVGHPGLVVHSYNGPSRFWSHGWVQVNVAKQPKK
jgi:predicted O-methyltransferase YrrM